ncbi:MAG: hypothetical protein JJE53_02760 [Candidatus Pacebacteria bacterium]|nr:hypothetical protein [Candidatus Paceibacterota bacterium]
MKNIKIMFSPKIFKWAFWVLIGFFIILVIIRFFNLSDVEKTNNQVLKIHSTKLNMSDVLGDNLPPDPGVAADTTVEGVDFNKNGIRDDVEIAIFKEYPNSAKTRAVLLQYALALQTMTNQSFINNEIATAVIQEKSRSYSCIGEIVKRDDSNKVIMDNYFEETDLLRFFVENKQLNTTDRIKSDSDFYKEVRSYADLGKSCDIDISELSN